jgi:hypothetical protein
MLNVDELWMSWIDQHIPLAPSQDGTWSQQHAATVLLQPTVAEAPTHGDIGAVPVDWLGLLKMGDGKAFRDVNLNGSMGSWYASEV